MSGQFAAVSMPEAVRLSGEYKLLADKLGVSWRTLYKWGSGESVIPADRLEQLAEVFAEIEHGHETSEVLRGTADLLEQIAKAIADGKVTRAEAGQVRAQAQRCMFALECSARSIERQAEP